MADFINLQVDAVYRSGAKASTHHQFKTLCTEEQDVTTTESLIIEPTTTEENPLAGCDTSQKLELENFTLDMKVKTFGQEPGETQGLALASWTHSMDCISTYGLLLCSPEMRDCFEGSLKAGLLGATVKQDLGALIAPDKLQQCASYTLTVLPSDKVSLKDVLQVLNCSFLLCSFRKRVESLKVKVRKKQRKRVKPVRAVGVLVVGEDEGGEKRDLQTTTSITVLDLLWRQAFHMSSSTSLDSPHHRLISFDRNLSKLTLFVEQDPELLGLPTLVQEHKGEVRLTWRPANLCALGHHVKVWSVKKHPLFPQ